MIGFNNASNFLLVVMGERDEPSGYCYTLVNVSGKADGGPVGGEELISLSLSPYLFLLLLSLSSSLFV